MIAARALASPSCLNFRQFSRLSRGGWDVAVAMNRYSDSDTSLSCCFPTAILDSLVPQRVDLPPWFRGESPARLHRDPAPGMKPGCLPEETGSQFQTR